VTSVGIQFNAVSDFITGYIVGSTAQNKTGGGFTVPVNEAAFLQIVNRTTAPLVVFAEMGMFKSSYRYLTVYKGVTFCCTSAQPLELPRDTELVKADSIEL